jgi:hypothetical protein
VTPNPLVRVTLPMLRATYANFPAKAHHTPQNRCLFLAFGVLNHFFGRDWVERHVIDAPKTKSVGLPMFLDIDAHSHSR